MYCLQLLPFRLNLRHCTEEKASTARPTHVDANEMFKTRQNFSSRAMTSLTRRITLGDVTSVFRTEAQRSEDAELVVAAAAAAELCVVSSDLTAAGRGLQSFTFQLELSCLCAHVAQVDP